MISSLLTWGSKICIQFVSKTFLGEIKYDDMFFSCSSITVLLAAIFLFLFFERIYLNKIWIRAITLFAPLTFSVYLIHENYYIREFFIVDRFKWIAELPLYQMIPTLICIVLLIYFLCSVVDFIRSSLFKTIKIKKRITRLDNSVFKF